MILSNYWKWLNGALTINPTSTSYTDPTQDVGLVDINGSVGYISFSSSDPDRRYNNRNISVGMVRLGGGDDEIGYDDYEMSDDLINNVTISDWQIANGVSDAGLERTITVTGRNTSDSSTTITEVGYCKKISSEEYGDAYVLVAKTKLATPITVPAGASFYINVSWVEA